MLFKNYLPLPLPLTLTLSAVPCPAKQLAYRDWELLGTSDATLEGA